MPTSHDSKPRNRARRVKGRETPIHSAHRAKQRRVLRGLYVAALAREAALRVVLAAEGKTWRNYELASGGERRRLGTLALAMVSPADLETVAA